MRTKIALAACLAALSLAGCEDKDVRDAERARINEELPDGCRFKEMPRYAGERVMFVICDKRDATTTNSIQSRQSGKMHQRYTVTGVWLGEERP